MDNEIKKDNLPENNNDDTLSDVIDIVKKKRKSVESNKSDVKTPLNKEAADDDVKVANTPSSNEVKAPVVSDATKVNFTPVRPLHKSPSTPPKESTVTDEGKHAHTKEDGTSSGGISLDDFNDDVKPAKKKKVKVTFLGSTTFGLIKLLVYLAFVSLCVYLISSTVINVANDVYAFVKDDTEVSITLPENATTKDVAKILKDNGVIKYPSIFESYAKSRIKESSYLTGKYRTETISVNPMMNYDALINTLSDYERSSKGTVRVTIPEGLTVDETIDLLVSKGVSKKEDYIEALQNFEYDYKFATPLTRENLSEYRFDTNYSYRLEGYLFPDTYDFYINENPISAIDKLLTNFNRKFEEEFYTRCDQLGLTVDEVITLASMIEKEGSNSENFYYISSVFHNRLNNQKSFPFLNSDATLQYALEERTGAYELDTSLEHPYNTYTNKGLPPGPICNPGIEAIYAALYPEKTSYYYFYTKKNGETVYSVTYEQHMAYVNADRNN